MQNNYNNDDNELGDLMSEPSLTEALYEYTVQAEGHSDVGLYRTKRIPEQPKIFTCNIDELARRSGIKNITNRQILELMAFEMNKEFINTIKIIANTETIDNIKQFNKFIDSIKLHEKRLNNKLFLYTSMKNLKQIVNLLYIRFNKHRICTLLPDVAYMGSDKRFHYHKSHEWFEEDDIIIWDKDQIGRLTFNNIDTYDEPNEDRTFTIDYLIQYKISKDILKNEFKNKFNLI